jgi:hypothetical protein
MRLLFSCLFSYYAYYCSPIKLEAMQFGLKFKLFGPLHTSRSVGSCLIAPSAMSHSQMLA